MTYKFEKEDEGKLVSEINVTVPLTYKQIIIHNKDQDPHDIHLEKGGLDYSKNLGGLLCDEEYGISDKDPKIHKGKVITEFADTLEGVCKKKWQFSCWNEGDPNKEKMEYRYKWFN